MGKFVFQSIKDESMAYCFDSSEFMSYSGSNLGDNLYMFPTYGDNLTQHGPQFPATVSNFVDCLASLAKYLLQNPDDVEQLTSSTSWPMFGMTVSREEIDFLVKKVNYKEDKVRYYSFQEKKMSSSESKRYDKRWEEIPRYADGTMQGVLSLLFNNKRYLMSIERFFVYLKAKEYFQDEYNNYQSIEGCCIGSDEKFIDLEYSFLAVHYQVESARMMDRARNIFRCLESNWVNK